MRAFVTCTLLLIASPARAAIAGGECRSLDSLGKLVSFSREVAGRSRNWGLNPAVALVGEVPEDMFVLGDLHGGYHHMQDLLHAAGLIEEPRENPAKIRWSGGSSTLVVTGDLLDKGKKTLSVVQALMSLQAQAAAAGGRVIVVMGNHEVEFFSELKGYEKKEEGETFHDWLVEHSKRDRTDYLGQMHAGVDRLGLKGVSIGRWLQDLPLGAKVADWFFCHAGNTEGLTVAELEAEIRGGVSRVGFRTPFLARSDSIVEARLAKHDDRDDDGSPLSWWDKGGGKERAQARVARFLRALRANHIVQGHQPGRFQFPDGEERKPCQPFSHFRGATGKPDAVFFVDTCNSGEVREEEGSSRSGVILHFRLTGTTRLTRGTLVGYDEKGREIDLSERTGWETP